MERKKFGQLMNYQRLKNMIELAITFILIFVALLFEGVRRKIIARMQNRVGPPLLQPFYDLLKLLTKKGVHEQNLIFSLVPSITLATSLVILLFVSALFVSQSFLGFDYNFLLIGYLFILQDTFLIFGAVSSRSPFAVHSSMREMLIMLGYELAFLILLSLFFIKASVFNFVSYPLDLAILQLPLASILLFYVGYVILKITPYDVVNADAEISGGFLTEYYGKDLAILELAEFIKNFCFYIIFAFLVFGKSYFLPASLGILVLYELMRATTPRYSTFRAAKTFALILLLAFVDLFLVI
ncbi:MAG: NADH-quinone oxidoreductase subunit H [Candidatus Micrarchaeota archaeon]